MGVCLDIWRGPLMRLMRALPYESHICQAGGGRENNDKRMYSGIALCPRIVLVSCLSLTTHASVRYTVAVTMYHSTTVV